MKFWAKKNTTDWWISQDNKYRRAGKNDESEKYLKDNVKGFSSALEVGSGTGRLIGSLKLPERAALDINPYLLGRVKTFYPDIKTYVGDIVDFRLDKKFELVFCYQVLQHVEQTEIQRAINNMLELSSREVWFMEGWMPNKENGEQTHPANGGSYLHYIDSYVQPYMIDVIDGGKIKVYRVKV